MHINSAHMEVATDSVPAPRWSPRLPHPLIDALLADIESGRCTEVSDVRRMLSLVAGEVRRLRDETSQRCADKLAGAEREAREILLCALDGADLLRSISGVEESSCQ